jgi:hypothetical protein
MIKNLIPALVMLVVGGSVALGQPDTTIRPPCDKPWCIDQKFKYRFCEQGSGLMVEKCSADPNNDSTHSPPLRPAKKAIPMCFKLDLSSISKELQRIIIDPSTPTHEGANLVVFDIMDVEVLLKQAELDWTLGICSQKSQNQEYQACCLKVRFSSNISDFKDNPIDITRAYVYDPPEGFYGNKGQNYCRVDCDRSYMVLNFHNAFTRPIEEEGPEKDAPRRFFFTRNLDGLQQLRPDLEYSSLYSIMAHEMGHWMGMGHMDASPDTYGKRCEQPEGSIMTNGYVGQWNQVIRPITDADKCAFMKLYCCYNFRDLLEVEAMELAAHDAFQLVPNPLRQDLVTVELKESGRASSLRVLNSIGGMVLERSLSGEEREIAIDAAGWPNGVYFVTIGTSRGTFGRKLVIQR